MVDKRPGSSFPSGLAARLPDRRSGLGIALALGLGTGGGAVAAGAGLPLPWMLGPMLFCAIAALAGAPVVGPIKARPVVVPVLGVMLGAGFTPEIFGQLGTWAVTFALLPVFILISGALAWVIYRHVGGYDGRTAFFCAAPGGLNEMILMGAEAGADERRIALSHAVRIFVVISVVAFSFAMLEGTTTAGLDAAFVKISDLSPISGAALLACAIAGAPLARWARLPAAPLFGPMLLSAALHLSGLVTDPPPSLLVIVAQIVIGTILGCRFAGATLRETGMDIVLSAAAALALLAVTILFALAVTGVTGEAWTQAVLAFAPGGLAEMSLLALAKNQDVAYVATSHVARIVMVLFMVKPVFALVAERLPLPPDRQ